MSPNFVMFEKCYEDFLKDLLTFLTYSNAETYLEPYQVSMVERYYQKS